MGKSLVAFGIITIVAIISMLSFGALNAYSRDNSNDIFELQFSQYGMMGLNNNLYSFERIYLHLSTDNQEKLDSAFANELITTDIQQKTVVEVVEIIEQIKSDIIDDVQIEYSTQRFGMMGGNMMGYGGNDPYANCGYQNNASTYEWLYIHSSDAQRDSLDLSFAEAIMNLDLSNLSVQELVESINEIKTNLVNQLSNLVQPNE